MAQQENLSHLLPGDVLVDIFRRLAPRSIAASSSVCKAWCALIDDHRLLRDLLPQLPLSLGGIFTTIDELGFPHFLSRPSTARPAINSDLGYFEYVMDHCNGLLLLTDSVLNPATQRSAPLPPAPEYPRGFRGMEQLVFDPIVSPHYEVLSIPHVDNDGRTAKRKKLKWPPSPCIIHVFSSRTGQWEKRMFFREGKAAGTVAHMASSRIGNSVYWRGVLYVHCQTNFVMRISLSSNTYRVIEPPIGRIVQYSLHLGKSENGVYFASLIDRHRLHVWLLNESCAQTEWVLKHDKSVKPFLPCSINYGDKRNGPWILQHVKYYKEYDEDEATAEHNVEWDSDNDDVVGDEDRCGDHEHQHHHRYSAIIGFHPYKEVIFMHQKHQGLAYHLSSSKLQYLGKLHPKCYIGIHPTRNVESCFTYTPCRMGEFPDKHV